jgi:ATP-dependent Lhr-like helicase
MKTTQSALGQFHPLISRWFSESLGEPTDLQERAWPRVASGEHTLITGPTGSGKTMAAFLWAINQLVTRAWDLGETRVVYVSPLRALNNDVQRNLIGPLRELDRIFAAAGQSFPPIRVITRSGDTPESDRRHMLRHPPEILITTPESLNLLLSSRRGRAILGGVFTVILDEIHAVVGNKRGVHLITAVDRLVALSGEFQRIALSATVRPLDVVAAFVGGYRVKGHADGYEPRSVGLVSSGAKKGYELQVGLPAPAPGPRGKETVWEPLVNEIKKIIGRNRSTLVFTNSRRLCERLTHMINEGEARPVAYAHHGSLSREIRAEVERKLKDGDLRAIVATHSLELGIDIGALDEVVLVQSPASVSSAVQRIGRSGHGVGEISRGILFATHPLDLVEAAVLAPAVLEQDIEPTRTVETPLDVLAQVIVSMVGIEPWDVDALYVHLKTAYPYRSLSRRQFDLVLEMLAGRYADSRIRELRPQVSIDRLENTVIARKGALQNLYLSGGTIPDRGYFHLRHHQTGALIGELDEEFVWEAKVGQTFTLGAQTWKVERITHNDVFVLPGAPRGAAAPFWRAEEQLRDFHFSERIGLFLETCDGRLEEPDFKSYLEQAHFMDRAASEGLIHILKEQRQLTRCPLPHRHQLLVEFVRTGPGGYQGNQVILHTLWGGRVNRPFAMALEAAWEERFGKGLQVFVSNDCVSLLSPNDTSGEEILSLVPASRVQGLLKRRVERSGFFGARFRECAGRALLLTRARFNERMPLWLSRVRSQKLLDAVLPYQDFPILLETWRNCLRDEFDLDALSRVLSQLESGAIAWAEARTTRPSPLARHVTWPQINELMYLDDRMRSTKGSRLSSGLLHEVAFTPELRPPIPLDLIERFELKRQRLSPGYSPESPRDLLDWIKERLLIPSSEWERLMEAVESDHGEEQGNRLAPIKEKLARLHPPEGSGPLIAALEVLPRVIRGLYGDPGRVGVEAWGPGQSGVLEKVQHLPEPEEEKETLFTTLLAEWLQFYGPRPPASISLTLGVSAEALEAALDDLAHSETVVTGNLVKDSDDEYVCDSENYEILLRLMRSEARPSFEPLPVEELQVFLAKFQGLTHPEGQMEGLLKRIEQLVCYPAPAGVWEGEILPARVKPYDRAWLDALMRETDLLWVGMENRHICFVLEPDLDLLKQESDPENGMEWDKEEDHGQKIGGSLEPFELDAVFRDGEARYDFGTLLRISDRRPEDLAEQLWAEVWRGRVINDTFLALRRGIETGFKVKDVPITGPKTSGRRRNRAGGRTAFSSWKSSLPAGNWQRLPGPGFSEDLIDREERTKDRARLLLDRYGIVFRELLRNESPPFRWPHVFRALRLMELSGEVLSGYFFHGASGPQFISPSAFRMLRINRAEEAVYWICAVDPASVCGMGLDGLKGVLPRRVVGTHLVYQGARLVLVSLRHGKRLTFQVPPEDPSIENYLGFLHHLLVRSFQPMRSILIETINGEPAAGSPYVAILRRSFDVLVDYRHVTLYRKYSG